MIVSSDLIRATSTAAPLARLTGLDVTLDKDLRERHGGCWEGLTDAEIRARYPAEHATWTPPDGEPAIVVAERVGAALQRIATAAGDEALAQPRARGGADPARAGGGLAVVVSHGAALRLGASWLLGMPEEIFGALGPLSNCSWSVLGLRHGRWRLLEHNAGTLPEPILSDDR
jgi:glucosyl-3-phosphoglycerate phosphatase